MTIKAFWPISPHLSNPHNFGQKLLFWTFLVLKIIVLSLAIHVFFLCFSVGMITNAWVLIAARENYLNPFVRLNFHQSWSWSDLKGVLRKRTNVHFLVFHLTLADTITCFITLPMETVWRITVGVSDSSGGNLEFFLICCPESSWIIRTSSMEEFSMEVHFSNNGLQGQGCDINQCLILEKYNP